jgi:hypothetical protein
MDFPPMNDIALPPPGAPLAILKPARFVRPHVAHAVTGLTVKAIEKKIETGVWVEGKEYRRAPDGLIYVDLEGFERWVAKGRG